MTGDKRWLLAVDTSTEMAGVALYDGCSLYELTWRAGRNQTVALLDQLLHFMKLNAVELPAVGAVAVAKGPGTFNGLRVGLSVAKGLSYGHGIPIIGVDTLEATAYPHRPAGLPIRAFVPAGRGRVVMGDFRQRNNRWMRVGEVQNQQFADLAWGLAETTLLVGECPQGMSIDDIDDSHVEVPRAALRLRRPGYVAEIAHRRWKSNDSDEIASLEPVYVHSVRSNAG